MSDRRLMKAPKTRFLMRRLSGSYMLRAYCAATSYFLLFSTGALGFIDRMIYGIWVGKGGDKITQTTNLLAIVVSVLLFCQAVRGRRHPHLNRLLPLAAVGLLLSSALWSVEPSTTMTRGVAYLFVVVGAIGVAGLYGADQVMKLTASIIGFLAAVSLLLLFVRPDTVTIGSDFIGVFPQINVLGQAMVVGVLAGLHGMRIGARPRVRNIGVTALCALVAVFSKSTTSSLTIFVFFALHCMGTLYIKGGARRILSVFLMIALALASILLMANSDLVFSLLEKDSSLTGRADLWPYVIDYVSEKPVLGWGFAGFWTGSNPRVSQISLAVGWYVTEAHNGLLQLLLDIGFVGTALFLFLWTRNLALAVKCMNGLAPETGVSLLLLLAGTLLIGVSEQVLVTVDGLTVQFFLLGFTCEAKLRASSAMFPGREHQARFPPCRRPEHSTIPQSSATVKTFYSRQPAFDEFGNALGMDRPPQPPTAGGKINWAPSLGWRNLPR
jgi:exopolysaccharide production protein ExoQ